MQDTSLPIGAVVAVMLLGCGSVVPTDSGQDGGSSSSPTATTSGTGDSGPSGSTSTGDSHSSGISTSGSITTADTIGGSESDTGIKSDFGIIPDVGIDDGECRPGDPDGDGKMGKPDFSYLWAANSAEGTISKIDTQAATEIGRFRTGPDTLGSPSRTSVSLSGDVAVANRNGGITKIYALGEDCLDTNGTPGIQTSADNAALQWDQEECRAWHIPFEYDSQRPVAWAPGTWNASACSWESELLWTAGRVGQGTTDEVILIDGDAGIVLETVSIPGLKQDAYGLYGAAVDADGNFWATGWASGNQIVRVTLADMEVSVWEGPDSTGTSSHWYGMTADLDGFIWNCGGRAARFDPETESWTVGPEVGASAGCTADATPEGLLWMAYFGGVLGVDRTTLDIVHDFATPTSYGVSIDLLGNVWTVNSDSAHRVDPSDGTVTSYAGLDGAYTYSDMTGHALMTVSGL